MYYIYYVKGIKVGCTNNLKSRVEQQQGYSKDQYSVLFSTKSIRTAGKSEKYFQELLGYKTDKLEYQDLPINKKNNKIMKYRIDKQTVTFGNKGDVLTIENLMEIGELVDDTKEKLDYKIIISKDVARWILKNQKESAFGNFGNFVYLEALKKKFSVEVNEEPYKMFDKIRGWATERGLYDKGDTKTQFIKLQEESGELACGILKEDKELIKDSIGDIVVVLTNLAHLSGFSIEECIEAAYNEIKNRKGKMNNGTFEKETK